MAELIIDPPLIAHRGASAYAPENTLAAFIKAQQLGVRWVEFDVMLTRCGEVVVIHDETLERTTDGVGEVSHYPYSYLQTLDAGSWFGAQFKGEKIPTLKEVLVFLAQHSMCVNVEVKAQAGLETQTVRRVIEVLETTWPKHLPQPLLSSFDMPVLQALREHSMDHQLGLLMHQVFEGWEAMDLILRSTAINVNEELLDREMMEKLKGMGKPVLAYTVNDVARARELFGWGVAAVFTDYPDLLG